MTFYNIFIGGWHKLRNEYWLPFTFINYAEPLTGDIVRNCQLRFYSAKNKHEYKQREYFKHVVFHTANDKTIRGWEVADSAHGNAKVHFTSSWGASFPMVNLSIFIFSYTDSRTDTDSTIPTFCRWQRPRGCTRLHARQQYSQIAREHHQHHAMKLAPCHATNPTP